MTYENLKREFSALSGIFDGYIQMSDAPLQILANEALPSWDALHSGANFIFEAAFFCKESQQSISIRQFNDEFLFISVNLRDFAEKEFEHFIALNGKLAKIYQIWQAEKDENCLNLPVLKPKFTLFAGFVEIQGEKNAENSAFEGENSKGEKNG